MTALDYTIVGLYLAGATAVGACFGKSQTSLKEFFLGGKNVPWWAAAFSGIATMISGVSYLGGPGQAFKTDFTYLQYRLAVPVAAALICLLFIPFFYRLDVYTAYEYLEKRFDLKTRTLAAALFMLLRCSYLGVVIYAPSLVIAQMTGLPLRWIVLVTGLLTTLYTTIGGIRGVIWTDTLQLGILIGGLIISFRTLLDRIDGGWNGMLAAAGSHGKLQFFDFSFSLDHEITVWGGLIGGCFFMLSQYGVDQAELQRFLTTSSVRRSQAAVASAMVAATVIGILLFLIGAALWVFYSQHPEKQGLGINPDRVYPKFILEELPSGLTGLVIAGVLSASMSAISGVLNSLTTVALSDFYQRFRRRTASVAAARLLTCGFGMLCTLVALAAGHFGTILAATGRLTNFFGGTLAGVFLLGMLTSRANASGAFAGALCGFGGVFAVFALTNISWMWYGAISATLSFTCGALFSLLSPPPSILHLDGLTLARRGSRREQVSIAIS